MAHFAEIDTNGMVLRVIVVPEQVTVVNGEEDEQAGIQYLKAMFGDTTIWRQTSFNGTIRKNYATAGGSYLEDLDVFVPPKPYESWILDQASYLWTPPVPPVPGRPVWDEATQAWVV